MQRVKHSNGTACMYRGGRDSWSIDSTTQATKATLAAGSAMLANTIMAAFIIRLLLS
jgi:hypothetical protein